MNFVNLYNKSSYLKKVNSKRPGKKKSKSKTKDEPKTQVILPMGEEET